MKLAGKILMLLSSLMILSCDKEEISQVPMNQNDIWNCYHVSEWTDLKIRDELTGTWKLTYTVSYWAPDEGRNTENENIIVEFSKDSTLSVIADGELQSTTNWTVTPEDGELFGLELDPRISSLLSGRILICQEILEFNDSYIDGSDNYFERIE